MCQRALSKYILGQPCNYTFPDHVCHALFSVSLYEEECIPEDLPLSFHTPCITKYNIYFLNSLLAIRITLDSIS
jgi:hypothetical protein